MQRYHSCTVHSRGPIYKNGWTSIPAWISNYIHYKVLSIPKLQRCKRWSLKMDKQFPHTLYWACDYLLLLGLKLTHVSIRRPGHTYCTFSAMFDHALILVEFTHILQGNFTGTRTMIRLFQCQWSNHEGYGHRSGPVFCLLLWESSDYAQPITGQVTEVTCPVIGQAQHELSTPSKRQKTGPEESTNSW